MKKRTKIFIQKIVLVVTFALCFAIFSQTLSMVRNLWTMAIITETAKLSKYVTVYYDHPSESTWAQIREYS